MSSPPPVPSAMVTAQQHSTCTKGTPPVPNVRHVTPETDSSVNLDRSWFSLKPRLNSAFQKMKHQVRLVASEWVSIYTDLDKLCKSDDDNHKKLLYAHIREYIKELVNSQLQFLRQFSGPSLLAHYNERWKLSCFFASFLKRMTHYLHRYWISDNSNVLFNNPVRPIDRLLMFYWRENLLTELHSIVDIALVLVDDDRRGVKVDRTLISDLVKNLEVIGSADVLLVPTSPSSFLTVQKQMHQQSSLNLYQQFFEEPFLAATINFYKTHGNVFVDPDNVSAFMKTILSRLEREEDRARAILHKDSILRVRDAAQEQLIGNQIEYLQSEAKRMIGHDQHADLDVVYSLLKRVEDGLSTVRTFFVNFVRAEGNTIVVNHVRALSGKEDIRHNLVLIEKLALLYRKHESLVRRSFEGSPVLLMAIDDAFRGFVNRTIGAISLPNLLAHYIDYLMRSKRSPNCALLSQTKNDAVSNVTTVEETKTDITACTTAVSKRMLTTAVSKRMLEKHAYLTELVRFFMYLEDKEVFCEMHRCLFAKRLLSSGGDEASEMLFISLLEEQMGGIYTQRFQGMLKDSKTSYSLCRKYSKYVRERRVALANSDKGEVGATGDTVLQKALSIDVSAHVLNTLHWPKSKFVDLKVPEEIAKCHEVFTEFYMRDRESRKLTWAYDMSTVTLRAHFGDMTYMFVMSITQACILLLFNNTDELSLEEIGKRLNVSVDEVQGQVKPLLFGRRSRVLKLMDEKDGSSKVSNDGGKRRAEGSVMDDCGANVGDTGGGSKTRKRARREIESKQAVEGATREESDEEDEEYGSNWEKEMPSGWKTKTKRIGVNGNFKACQYRIIVPTELVEVANREAVVSQKSVVVDRSTQVDAAIVRLMKGRRQVLHVELCSEVMRVLSPMFVADPRLIKSRVERLIEMEYMTRDEKETKLYRYNA